MVGSGPRRSADTGQADWIAERLAPWPDSTLTMIVPTGFEAYAGVLRTRPATPGVQRGAGAGTTVRSG